MLKLTCYYNKEKKGKGEGYKDGKEDRCPHEGKDIHGREK